MAITKTQALIALKLKAREIISFGIANTEERYDNLHPHFAIAIKKLEAASSITSFRDRAALAQYIRNEEFLAKRGI